MSETDTQVITPELIEKAMSYREYRDLIDELLKQGKTTGQKQSESRTEYTALNVHRMNRLDKLTAVNRDLKAEVRSVEEPWIWLVLTEAWCGDAAQNIPIIHKIAEHSPKIDLRFVLRDEHPELMDRYLTNGTRSIPKLIALKADTLEELGTWGPRPEKAQDKVRRWKSELGKKEWVEKLHRWYADNKGENLQQEFEKLIEEWK